MRLPWIYSGESPAPKRSRQARKGRQGDLGLVSNDSIVRHNVGISAFSRMLLRHSFPSLAFLASLARSNDRENFCLRLDTIRCDHSGSAASGGRRFNHRDTEVTERVFFETSVLSVSLWFIFGNRLTCASFRYDQARSGTIRHDQARSGTIRRVEPRMETDRSRSRVAAYFPHPC